MTRKAILALLLTALSMASVADAQLMMTGIGTGAATEGVAPPCTSALLIATTPSKFLIQTGSVLCIQ
jgi:hypothetical protein